MAALFEVYKIRKSVKTRIVGKGYGMRTRIIYLAALLTLILCACSNREFPIRPAKAEQYDFNLDEAVKMIEPGEKLCAGITRKQSVSRQEFEQFLTELEQAYPDYTDGQWEYMFFLNEDFEDETKDTIRLNTGMFYPTICHQGIEVVSAVVAKESYEKSNQFLDRESLIIRETYTGEDERLKDWYREHIFEKDEKGHWKFVRFGGTANLTEEGITADYLPLK